MKGSGSIKVNLQGTALLIFQAWMIPTMRPDLDQMSRANALQTLFCILAAAKEDEDPDKFEAWRQLFKQAREAWRPVERNPELWHSSNEYMKRLDELQEKLAKMLVSSKTLDKAAMSQFDVPGSLND